MSNINNNEQIFADKIRKEATFFVKILDISSSYETLFSKVKLNTKYKERLNEDINYHNLWISVAELYRLFENNYSLKLKDTDTDKYMELVKIMKKYRDLTLKNTFEELTFVVDCLNKIATLNGFDDISLAKFDKGNFFKPRQKWSELNQ